MEAPIREDMKHRRGIDLTGSASRDERFVHRLTPEETAWLSFVRLEQWYDLGAYCSKCEREGWLDRYELAKKWSPGTIFLSLAPRLRCLKCGNKSGNGFQIRKLAR